MKSYILLKFYARPFIITSYKYAVQEDDGKDDDAQVIREVLGSCVGKNEANRTENLDDCGFLRCEPLVAV